jgi:hypothetical protein
MSSRISHRLVVCVVLLASWAYADDKKGMSPQYSNLHFTVVKDDNNKPVRNASVILHPVNKNGTQGKGGFQLKTDNEGNTATEGIPYGPLRVQVLAPGFQTFGDDYQVNQPTMDIQIRLKRPGEQFSTYDKGKSTQPPPPENKPQ